MPKSDISIARIAIRTKDNVRVVLDPADVYYLDATEGDTIVRQWKKKVLIDTRRLDEIEPLFRRHGFLRIHRSYLVNLRKIREIRPRGRDYEVKLAAPVNKVLPVSRDAAPALLAALE